MVKIVLYNTHCGVISKVLQHLGLLGPKSLSELVAGFSLGDLRASRLVPAEEPLEEIHTIHL